MRRTGRTLTAGRLKNLSFEIAKIECTALCLFAAKNEAGFVVATHGKNKREVISNFGVPLVKYNKASKTP